MYKIDLKEIDPQAETEEYCSESWEEIYNLAKEIFNFPEQYGITLPGYPTLGKAEELIEDDEDDWEI